MEKPNLKPEKITKPFQLLAAWLLGLGFIDALFLNFASKLPENSWISQALIIAAIANVPLFLLAIFLLQTKYRPEMQEDQYYAAYLERKRSMEERAEIEETHTVLATQYVDAVLKGLQIDDSERQRLSSAMSVFITSNERQAIISNQDQMKDFQLMSPQEMIKQTSKKNMQIMPTIIAADIRPYLIKDCINRVLSIITKKPYSYGKEFKISKEIKKVYVMGTRGSLDFALTEIIMNAVLYSPPSSVIDIDISEPDQERIILTVTNQIYRRDSLNKVLEIPPGMGMGLFSARQALEMIGGALTVSEHNAKYIARIHLQHYTDIF